MKKLILSIFAFILITPAFAQEQSNRFVHGGILRAQGTLATGSMLGPGNIHGTNNIYLHGNLEYYIDDLISVRGDSYYFLNSLNGDNILLKNHSSFAGVSYHFRTKNHIDPYFGIQPGLSITQANLNPCPEGAMCFLGPIPDKTSASPLLSGVVGFNYYAQKVFHLFIEARYQHGTHLSNMDPVSLSELKFSFGLGWNLDVKKAQ